MSRLQDTAWRIVFMFMLAIFFTITLAAGGVLVLLDEGPRTIARNHSQDDPEFYPWVLLALFLGILGAVSLWLLGLFIAGYVLTHLPQ